MQLTSLSLALTRAGFLTFSPSSLFPVGVEGVWYEPSPTNGTCFQDSAGTQPVTAVEQPVGLMLDKSKGLVLGSELVTNGDFSNGTTGWSSFQATLNVVDGWLRVTLTGTSGSGNTVINTTVGKWYKATALLRNVTAGGSVTLRAQENSGAFATLAVSQSNLSTTAAAVEIVFLATTATTQIRAFLSNVAGQIAEFDNISVRELPGNHAFQTTSTSRPVLSARYNLLTATEDLSGAIWAKVAATVTSVPDSNAPGAMYAVNSANDSISASARYVAQTVTVAASTQHTARFYAKAGTSTAFRFMTRNDDATRDALFSLSGSGSVTSTAGGATATITATGNGIYLCTVTWTTGADTSILYTFNAGASIFGDGSVMFYVSAPDFRVTNDAAGQPAYQRVNTATDYDTTGFKPYLRFDGTDDWLQTNSINFTATDKMTVFAGVRKLVNGGFGIIAELSSSITANEYGFVLLGPNGTIPDYAFSSKGTLYSEATASGYDSPITNVISGIGNISGDQAILRVNGTQAAISISDQGTGNYGAYPLYIGRRGGTSLPFNGRLYGLIVVGSALTAQQITNTENWLNQRTGAY